MDIINDISVPGLLMTNPIFHLYQLQKLDTRLDMINDRLKKIAEAIRTDLRISRVEDTLAVKREEYKEKKEMLKTIENAIHEKRMKIEQSEASLYGGGIKNPKELQDLQKEIASIKSSIMTLEESELSSMFDLEGVEKELAIIEKNLVTITGEVHSDQSQLISERDNLIQDVNKINHERLAVTSQLSSMTVNQYDELRKKKKGIAIAIIEEQSCSACGATLTPAECQTAKSQNALFSCSSCGRLLYAG